MSQTLPEETRRGTWVAFAELDDVAGVEYQEFPEFGVKVSLMRMAGEEIAIIVRELG